MWLCQTRPFAIAGALPVVAAVTGDGVITPRPPAASAISSSRPRPVSGASEPRCSPVQVFRGRWPGWGQRLPRPPPPQECLVAPPCFLSWLAPPQRCGRPAIWGVVPRRAPRRPAPARGQRVGGAGRRHHHHTVGANVNPSTSRSEPVLRCTRGTQGGCAVTVARPARASLRRRWSVFGGRIERVSSTACAAVENAPWDKENSTTRWKTGNPGRASNAAWRDTRLLFFCVREPYALPLLCRRALRYLRW